MADWQEIAVAFEQQAVACDRLGSPFTAYLCTCLPSLLADDPVLGAALAAWPADPVESALALRLCGALHRLVRSGRVPDLAALYPPAASTGPALDRALAASAETHGALLVEWLASAPQTNEVARSGVLLGGLLTIAAKTGLPLTLLEIGSSAGLNLYPDAYAYDLAHGRTWGRADAEVRIASDWRGSLPPLDASLQIVARAGVDLATVNAADRDQRERMLAYIWPDQPERLARAAAALDHVAAHPPDLARGDAAEWLEARLAEPAEAGTTRVLIHSIMWQYLPARTQARIEAAMDRAGAAATGEAPLAWLRLEPDGKAGSAAIPLTLWPGGGTRELGRGDYHGRFAEWV
ncbi:MAG: DUF2332 family protein [Paracoccaceae bacterium]|nr:DUF2332 family protein [Paracoccaceae bacterium]